MEISVVTALYKSERYVEEFYRRHRACLEKLGVAFEFILVSDDSPDDSAGVVRRLQSQTDHIRFVELSRNFGQHAAMFAGMAQARGRYVYVADCDLEEAPENIVLFYADIKSRPEVDVVYAVLKQRSGGLFRKYGGSLFYLILNLISKVEIAPNQAWQRMMTQRYVQALLQYGEVETLPAGLMALAGFQQIPREIDKSFKGSSSYSFKKRLNLAVNSLTSFSSTPLIAICLVGLGVTALSFSLIVFIVICKLMHYDFKSGWITIISSIWCVGGLLLSSVGVVGVYLAKIFNQVKNRPLYIIKSVTP